MLPSEKIDMADALVLAANKKCVCVMRKLYYLLVNRGWYGIWSYQYARTV